MDLPPRKLAHATAAIVLFFTGSSAGLAQQWLGPLVAEYDDEEHDCRLEVSGNGRFYRLTAFGLEPGESAWLTMTNNDMKPIERAVRADGSGTWADFYLPALPSYRSGLVQASLSGGRCELSVAFRWERPTSSIDPVPNWPVSRFPED